jgi:hypothetical protein
LIKPNIPPLANFSVHTRESPRLILAGGGVRIKKYILDAKL